VSVALADFNGDGKLDLATINSVSVSVLLGNGDGTLQPPVTDTDVAIQSSFAVGDFNADGKSDLAMAGSGGIHQGAVFVMFGNGDGTFQPAATNLAGSAIGSVALGDFNGDGKTDLVVSSAGSYDQGFTNNGVLVLLGNGDGTFQPAYTVAQRSGFVSGGG